MPSPPEDRGFSLIELVVAMGVLMAITAVVTSSLLQMTQAQTTIWNRTEMHSGIRGATELLQQEVGQAGKISVPGTPSLPGEIQITADTGTPTGAASGCDPAFPSTNADTIHVNTTAGVFASTSPPVYELLTTMDGDSEETIKIASVNAGASTLTACFQTPHLANTILLPLGAFATGIIPPTGIVNGSDGYTLKMFGDINGDGNMVYVEYKCDIADHKLYRNVMNFDAASKPAVTNSQILLGNIVANPGGSACFTYQTDSMVVQGTNFTFVLDVAVTLTVQTEQIDPVTKQYQTETKALLNVSPRNVFDAWMLASVGYTDRIQSTPATVTNLLAG